MITDDESPLAPIDLHAWRVPPPVAIDRAALLGRALSPATVPPRSPRWAWLIVATVVINAAIALLVIRFTRSEPAPAPAVALPAGGDTDARVRMLVQQLELEQRELERKLAELQALKALVLELQQKLQVYEAADRNLRPPDRTVPRPKRSVPQPPEPPDSDREAGTKESLDRQDIAAGITAVKPTIVACGKRWTATGLIKTRARVLPSGIVASVTIDSTVETGLADCITKAIYSARFPPTRSGASFSYPFKF